MKKFFYLRALTKEDFADQRIVAFMQQHEDFSSEEYQDFTKSITVGSENAKKIIDFIVHYQNGCLCPQKYNFYEPLKLNFNSEDICQPVRGLSFPGGSFYFKRNLPFVKCEGAIENHRFAAIWECIGKKTYKRLKPIAKEPELLGEIKIWFNIKDLLKNKKDISFIEQLVVDLNKIIKIEEYEIKEVD